MLLNQTIYYLLWYILIVLFTFIIIFWGFNHVVNEMECLSISLIAGLIYLSIAYKPLINQYTCQLIGDPANTTLSTNIQYLLVGTIFLVVLSFIILILTGISLITFGKSKKLDIFKL